MSRTLSEAEQRLRQVTSLKDGWYGGDEGIGPDPRLYRPLRSLLLALSAEKLPLPYIYPIYEGGVQCEWAGSLKDMRGVERATLSHLETVGLLRDRDDLVTDCGGGIWSIDVAYMNAKVPPFTEGAWRWRVKRSCNDVDLVSDAGGGPIVMDFSRWGMRGASPRFPVAGLMRRVDALAKDIPGQEHNNSWNQTTAHPNALIMALAPDLYRSLLATEAYLEDLEKSDVLDARGKALLDATKKLLDSFRKDTTT